MEVIDPWWNRQAAEPPMGGTLVRLFHLAYTAAHPAAGRILPLDEDADSVAYGAPMNGFAFVDDADVLLIHGYRIARGCRVLNVSDWGTGVAAREKGNV